MIDLINKMPASGEALLAFHLLRAPKRRNFLDFVAAVLFFIIPTVYFSYFFMYLLTTSIYYPFGLLTYFYAPFIFIVPVIFILAVRGAFWFHDSAFERTAGIYQIHPQVAKDEVMSSQKLDEEAANSTVWVVKEWERKKRNGRQTSITMSVLILSFSMISLVLSYNVSILYYLSAYSLIFVIYPAPVLLALVTYFLVRRWDKRCLAELYYETTPADEPIWVD